MIRLRVDDKEIGEPQTLSDESPVGTSYSQVDFKNLYVSLTVSFPDAPWRFQRPLKTTQQ